MWETAEDFAELQQLMDRSFAGASEHLRSIMTEARRLSAERVAAEVPCPAVLNIATVTARGEPRISAVDGHLLHGHWYFTTPGNSPKGRQLQARNAISASFTPRDGFGLFCHGRVALLGPGPERQMLDDHFRDTYGQPASAFGDGIVFVRIDPDWLVAFGMTDAELVQIDADRAARETERRDEAPSGPPRL